MNERYETPETSVNVRRITKNGNEEDYQDTVAGLEIAPDGVLRIDLRNLRPMRVLDREGVIVEVYLKDILTAVALAVERAVTE